MVPYSGAWRPGVKPGVPGSDGSIGTGVSVSGADASRAAAKRFAAMILGPSVFWIWVQVLKSGTASFSACTVGFGAVPAAGLFQWLGKLAGVMGAGTLSPPTPFFLRGACRNVQALPSEKTGTIGLLLGSTKLTISIGARCITPVGVLSPENERCCCPAACIEPYLAPPGVLGAKALGPAGVPGLPPGVIGKPAGVDGFL